MRHYVFTGLCRTPCRQMQRRSLMLALGIAILTALAISDADSVGRHEGFSEPARSLSFMPETVRLRTQP